MLSRRSLITTGAAVISSACGRPPSDPFDFSKSPPIIDTHAHLSTPLPPDRVKPAGADGEKFYAGSPAARAEWLKREMTRSNTTVLFCMGRLMDDDTDPLGIGDALQCAAFVSGLKVIGAVDPRKARPAYLRAVEQQIENNRNQIVALKAYLGYLPFAPDDPAYASYYAIAEKYNLPVILHTGDTWSTQDRLRFSHPLAVDDVAVAYPKVQFVLAHFGYPWHVDAAELVYKNANVWAELSGLFMGDESVVAEVLKREGISPAAGPGLLLREGFYIMERFDRVVYGSDFPLVTLAAYRNLMEAVVPKEQHDKVFRTNAERLFRVSASQPR